MTRRRDDPTRQRRLLSDVEEEILAVAKELDQLTPPAFGGSLHGALGYLRRALQAEKAVTDWWTPERWRRYFERTPADPEGERNPAPFELRPTPQEILRDLMPLAETGLCVLRAPSLLSAIERLAFLKEACGEIDALDGVANVLKSQPKASRPLPPFYKREWETREFMRYRSELAEEKRFAVVEGEREGSRWPTLAAEDAAALRSLERSWQRSDPTRKVSEPEPDDIEIETAQSYVTALERRTRRWRVARRTNQK